MQKKRINEISKEELVAAFKNGNLKYKTTDGYTMTVPSEVIIHDFKLDDRFFVII